MIWFLILIELVYEIGYGDAHDDLSKLRTFALFLIGTLWGLLDFHFSGNSIALYTGAFYVLARLAVFDIGFAVGRKLPWYYLGTDSEKHKWWDVPLQKINKWVLLAFRVAALLTVFYYEF
jgi:hypothetical protein